MSSVLLCTCTIWVEPLNELMTPCLSSSFLGTNCLCALQWSSAWVKSSLSTHTLQLTWESHAKWHHISLQSMNNMSSHDNNQAKYIASAAWGSNNRHVQYKFHLHMLWLIRASEFKPMNFSHPLPFNFSSEYLIITYLFIPWAEPTKVCGLFLYRSE